MRMRGALGRPLAWAFGLVVGLVTSGASAQTLEQSLSAAYINNPVLNAQRAATRAVDEKVPQALSGFRPQVFAGADAGVDWNRTRLKSGGTVSGAVKTYDYGLTVTQNVFNGFTTLNTTRSAEVQVLGARETLRNTEQNVLLDAVISYMGVVRDTAIVELQRQNVEALREQLRATRDRFDVGELTRTDVAQSEARLALAESQLIAARAALNASRAAFRRDIGVDPRRLTPARTVEHLLPKSIDACIAASDNQHPAIAAARHGVDVANLQVKVAEGTLLPVVSLEGSVSRAHDPGLATSEFSQASIFGRLTVPIYQGGAEYSRIRESKETLGQRRLEADVARDDGARCGSAVVRSTDRLPVPGRGDTGAGKRRADRAERRAGGISRRPAHDARRPERAGRTRECALFADHCSAGSRRQFVLAAIGDRTLELRVFATERASLRGRDSLQPGA